MKIYCGLLLIFLSFWSSQSTKLRSCESFPAPQDVRVDGCKEEPCKFKKGTTSRVDIDFIVLNDTKAMTASVVATLGSIVMPFPLLNKGVVCNYLLNGYCPADQNEHLTYELEMKVANFYPTTDVDAQVTITDDYEQAICCFKMAISVFG